MPENEQPEREWQDFLKACKCKSEEELNDKLQQTFLIMDVENIINPPKPEGHCILCGRPTTNYDYCYGCKKHVCQECTQNYEDPRGKHHFEDHQRTLRKDLL